MNTITKTVQIGRSRMLSEMAHPTWAASMLATSPAVTAHQPLVTGIIPAESADGPEPAHHPDPQVNVIPAIMTEKTTLRVAGYCRTSTDLESQQTSIENQKAHYRTTIENQPGWQLVDIYWESGVSGTKADTRPELQRLLSDCRAGRIDFVITKSISRFSRNTADLLEMVRSLSDLGIPIRFEKENLQTDTMATEFLLTVLGAFSQDESRAISSNMKWGIRKRFEAGTYRAARAPYGYRKNPKPTKGGWHTTTEPIYVIEPAEAEIVRRIFYACVNGKGAGVIAKELNAEGVPTWSKGNGVGTSRWTARSALKLLQNIFYTGDVLYQKTFMDEAYHQVKNKGQLNQYLNEGSHDAIIDKETFRKAQAMIAMRRAQYGEADRSNRYCFTGKLMCGCCGNRMYRGGTKRRFFLCYGHAHQHICGMGAAYEDEVQNAICTMLNKLAWAEENDASVFLPFISNTEAAEEIDSEWTQIRHQKTALYDRALAGKFTPELRVKKATLDAEERVLLKKKERIDAPTITDALRDRIRRRGIRPAFSHEDEDIITAFVESMTIWRGEKIEVRFSNGMKLTESMAAAEPITTCPSAPVELAEILRGNGDDERTDNAETRTSRKGAHHDAIRI